MMSVQCFKLTFNLKLKLRRGGTQPETHCPGLSLPGPDTVGVRSTSAGDLAVRRPSNNSESESRSRLLVLSLRH